MVCCTPTVLVPFRVDMILNMVLKHVQNCVSIHFLYSKNNLSPRNRTLSSKLVLFFHYYQD